MYKKFILTRYAQLGNLYRYQVMVHASKQIPRMKGNKHMPIKNRIRYDIHN